MLKIYEDIINEVISRLEQDEDVDSMSKAAIYDLRNDWRERLIECTQNEWTGNGGREMYGQRFRVYKEFSERSNDTLLECRHERDVDLGDKEHGEEDVSSDDSEIIGRSGNTGNYMICLYVKVCMSKGKWKCVFKQGFINIGNIDFVFSSAQGELEW
ncbi:large chain of transcription initiation factor IIA [Ordospora colligata]|uniref:Large chain of transcription initiation factor IIA n=1 Tax=Ordospora colligata OC4 TaxID=1354746 RepID=A0A0B2UG72_9MICR|nr:large chain of transcription initiation factor IIA [Ordospora colligata OC4]KHN70081.1 large chain of transcription initiation factor IIA [Ordospora colligata OC4]TBU16463.1 large chain of transcription initiation factor IIA [Ordospora colligata]TBU16648.1 large chain of transcription initiation factor IIA [Ordospora colligata]TBU19221.1 large chain of transcription initiation factor IIA [Ordospora colligata]